MMNKPGKTIKPDRPVTERKTLSISVDMDTDKLQLKLRAIAKHAEALADELDAIDKMIGECPKCNSDDVCTMHTNDELTHASCNDCGHVIYDDDLPTRLEGSE